MGWKMDVAVASENNRCLYGWLVFVIMVLLCKGRGEGSGRGKEAATAKGKGRGGGQGVRDRRDYEVEVLRGSKRYLVTFCHTW